MVTDWEKYKEIVPSENWLQVLDGLKKLPPYEPDEE
jgi:hypothetical protein